MDNPINQKILSLWEKHAGKHEFAKYYPLLYPEFQKGQLAVMGINPSFSDKLVTEGRKTGQFLTVKEKDLFFRYTPKDDPEKAVEVHKFDKYAIVKYSYFKRVKYLADEVGLKYQHVDLFLFRHTRQKEVLKSLNFKDSFFMAQIDLAFEYLKLFLDPKVILVANAQASRIVRDKWKDYIKFCHDDLGYDKILLNNGKPVPIIFRGAIRSLDEFSLQNLIWLIKKADAETSILDKSSK